ncbi:MAG: YIP1 family protein [Pseudomonadota bacterium]|nr:YIP1 family protein [Pseudomonadota bacterium]MEE3072599.1 YIP1 family protein [Pseudomonadota bacterium]
MTMTLPAIWQMVLRTLQDPLAMGQELIALRLSRATVWMAMTLVCVLSVLMFFVSEAVIPTAGGVMAPLITPMSMAVMVVGNLVMMIFAVFWTGRALEGNGRLEDIVLLMSWVQFMLLVAQVPQTVLALFSATLSSLLALGAVLYALWLIVKFTQAAHGFDSVGKAVLTVVLAIVGIMVGLAIVLSLIGASVIGGPV